MSCRGFAMEAGEGAVEGDDIPIAEPAGNFLDRQIRFTQEAGGFAQAQSPGMLSQAESVAAAEFRPQVTLRPSGPRGHLFQVRQRMGMMFQPIRDGTDSGQSRIRGRFPQCGIFLKGHQQKNQKMRQGGRLARRLAFTGVNLTHQGAGPIRGRCPMPDFGAARQAGQALVSGEVLHPNDTAGFPCGSFKRVSWRHQQGISSIASELALVGLEVRAAAGHNDQIMMWPLRRSDATLMGVCANPMVK